MSWMGSVISKYLKGEYDKMDTLWVLTKAFYDRAQRKINFTDKIVVFDDRFNNESKLIVVLAGKKKYLWEITLKRLNEYLEEKASVIVVNPGSLHSSTLRNICRDYGWSYLETKSRRVTTGVNIAINMYKDSVEWIYKMDDDIFVTKDTFKKLLNAYLLAKEYSLYYPAISLPVFNINEVTYVYFLKTLNIEHEFIKEFSTELKFGNKIVWSNPKVAVWLWSYSLPIDEVAKKFDKNPPYDICNMRISIGLMLIHKSTWLDMQGFSSCASRDLGSDEEGLVNYIGNKKLAWVIATNAFVGHFSYHLQESTIRKFFEKRKRDFDIT